MVWIKVSIFTKFAILEIFEQVLANPSLILSVLILVKLLRNAKLVTPFFEIFN